MFTRRFAASMVGTTLTAATLGLAALGFAGTASASSTDEAFLAQLQADGITPPSAARAIKDAHAVCDALDEGHSAKAVIKAVAKATGLSAKGAKTFAVDAGVGLLPAVRDLELNSDHHDVGTPDGSPHPHLSIKGDVRCHQ